NQRILVDADRKFTALFDSGFFPEEFSPGAPNDVYVVYGVAPAGKRPDEPLRMPFNRADYYVSTLNVPGHCADNTGVLRKAVLNHSGTFQGGIHQLLDCVADMQVSYALDNDGDGETDNLTDDISLLTAREIREKIKEVRIVVLAHEGQKDVNYRFPNDMISVGGATGRDFDLTVIPYYQNYRWRLYTLVVKPRNLAG
ncbi:MAG: PilW family protein, partial [Nitrospirota bacterium]